MFQTSKLKPSIVREIRTGALARLSAEPTGPTDLAAPCVAKMAIDDCYVSVHAPVQCETTSIKTNELASPSPLKRSARPSARANSSKCFPDPERSSAELPQVDKAPPPPGIQPPTQDTPERFYRGDSDSQVVTLAPGVLEVMQLLRRDFPASQFTPAVIGRITRMMRPSNGSNQLTAARIAKYHKLTLAEFAGDSSMFFDEVNLSLLLGKDVGQMPENETYE